MTWLTQLRLRLGELPLCPPADGEAADDSLEQENGTGGRRGHTSRAPETHL